jgi:tol-pal system beta propeller repeat protein TolB
MRQDRRHPALIVVSVLLLVQMLWLAPHAVAVTAPRGDLAKAAIVFARLQGTPQNYELWTMGAHGGNQHRLTRNDMGDFDPVWSPDGTRIAWVRYPEYGCNCGPSDVWLMNADGTDRHNLTNDADGISRPTWSPDGSQLAFTLDYMIWVIDADGSDEHQISPAGSYDFDPAWSPDGTRIAFSSDGGGSFDLFSMRPDGTDRRQLTHAIGISEYRPAWSPDGSKIAFTGNHQSGNWHVDLMQADGSGVHILVDASSLDPAWSPDGSRLAFYACMDDCALYRIKRNGADLEPLGRRRGDSDIQPDYRDVIPTT